MGAGCGFGGFNLSSKQMEDEQLVGVTVEVQVFMGWVKPPCLPGSFIVEVDSCLGENYY